MKSNGSISQNTAKYTGTSVIATMIAGIILSVFSSSAFANRPAAADESDSVTTPAVQDDSQFRPEAADEAEAPSAVEVMMQQQSQQPQQTGDIVQLPAKELQPGETLKIQLLDYPRRGMSMEKVQQEYGQPLATSQGVGMPPITHWTYSDRVVYFEYSTVLHVVAR